MDVWRADNPGRADISQGGSGFPLGGSRRLCADPDGSWLAKCAEPLDSIYDQTKDIVYVCFVCCVLCVVLCCVVLCCVVLCCVVLCCIVLFLVVSCRVVSCLVV